MNVMFTAKEHVGKINYGKEIKLTSQLFRLTKGEALH